MDVGLVLARSALHLLIRVHQRLSDAFAFIVARSRSDRIDVAPVALGLWMDLRISVDLGSGSEQDPGLHTSGEAEHVDRP